VIAVGTTTAIAIFDIVSHFFFFFFLLSWRVCGRLTRIKSLERRKAEREHSSEHEDHGDSRFGSTCILGLLEQATGGGHANPHDCTTSHTGEHQTTSTDLVDKGGSDKGEDELEA
jgi:hypothetical protein